MAALFFAIKSGGEILARRRSFNKSGGVDSGKGVALSIKSGGGILAKAALFSCDKISRSASVDFLVCSVISNGGVFFCDKISRGASVDFLVCSVVSNGRVFFLR